MYIDYKDTCADKAQGITDEDRMANIAFLAEGVKGVTVIFAGCFSDALLSSLPGGETALMTIQRRCCPDEYIGSVELYANGAINAYLRRTGLLVPTGMFRCR